MKVARGHIHDPRPSALDDSPAEELYLSWTQRYVGEKQLKQVFQSHFAIFPCLFTLGLYNSCSINALVHVFAALAEVHLTAARISSHLSNRTVLCLQPAVICLRKTLRFAIVKKLSLLWHIENLGRPDTRKHFSLLRPTICRKINFPHSQFQEDGTDK